MKKTIFIAQIAFALLAAPAFAGNDKNYTYLALGDSIPFGMNTLLLLPPNAPPLPKPSDFVGYPEAVAAAEKLNLVNASCPGESSGSFLKVHVLDWGCNSPHPNPDGSFLPAFKPTIGLKADYNNNAQMHFAESELASNKNINKVSLSIGANDVLLVLPQLQACGAAPDPAACQGSVLGPVLNAYAENLAEILTRIRKHYKGPLVLLTYYSPDPSLDGVAVAVNTVMTAVGSGFNVTFADGFNAFQIATAAAHATNPCDAGLLIPVPGTSPLQCDIHPSLLGREVLAGIVELAFQ